MTFAQLDEKLTQFNHLSTIWPDLVAVITPNWTHPRINIAQLQIAAPAKTPLRPGA
jgi:hypothetical protein